MEAIKIEKQYYTYEEFANLFGVNKFSLANMMCRGKFKKGRDYIKIGKKVLFKSSFINKVMDEGLE